MAKHAAPLVALPTVGMISNWQNDIGAVANKYLSLAGAKVLCIGLSEAEITEQVAVHGPKSLTSLTLWSDHIDAQTRSYELVIGDITKQTVFPDGHFDAVVTLSLLEHINPLADGLREMRRVTRHQGIIASMFGPAWSCAYGHHMYVRNPSDPLLNFSLWQMPAYMHLLWSKAEIRSFYRERGYEQVVIDEILHYMFEWQGINRCWYSEYRKSFEAMFQIEYCENMYNVVDTETLTRLRKAYPDEPDFTTYGAKVVLRNSLKEAASIR